MIGTTRSLRVFAYTQPADLRKGYEGLSAVVTSQLGCDVLSGDCYLFTNRTRTRAKVLVWDGTGLCVFQKRLEQGRFACLWKRSPTTKSLELTMSELAELATTGRMRVTLRKRRDGSLTTNSYELLCKCGLGWASHWDKQNQRLPREELKRGTQSEAPTRPPEDED